MWFCNQDFQLAGRYINLGLSSIIQFISIADKSVHQLIKQKEKPWTLFTFFFSSLSCLPLIIGPRPVVFRAVISSAKDGRTMFATIQRGTSVGVAAPVVRDLLLISCSKNVSNYAALRAIIGLGPSWGPVDSRCNMIGANMRHLNKKWFAHDMSLISWIVDIMDNNV